MFFCCIAFITSFALLRCFFYKSLIALYQAQVSVCNFICRLCLPSPDLSSALSAPQQTLPIPHHMQLPFLPMQLSFSPFSSFLGYVWGIIWSMSEACLRHVCGIIWGMSVVSSGICLKHHLGHVCGIIWGMSGTSSGACLEHHLGNVWASSGASGHVFGMSGAV